MLEPEVAPAFTRSEIVALLFLRYRLRRPVDASHVTVPLVDPRLASHRNAYAASHSANVGEWLVID